MNSQISKRAQRHRRQGDTSHFSDRLENRTNSSSPSRKIQIALCLLLFAVTVSAYFPAIQAGYVWDDRVSLYNNELIKANDGLYRFWFTSEAADYWPLSATTFWLEWRVWGNNPTPYHITNIALHALAAVVLWRVLKRLGISNLGAFLGGLLFAIHPVTVESVAWITERKNVLSMVLYLLAILAYLRFEDQGRQRWYVFALLAATAALLAKTSVVALPIVLLLLTWWRQNSISRQAVVRTAPFFAISLILGLMTVWFQHHNAISDAVVRPEGLASRVASAGWVVWFYLYKLVLPINLAIIYPRWDVDGGNVLSYAPLAMLCIGLAVLWQYRNSWSRGTLAAIGSFVVVLAPVLGLVDMAYARYSLVADHLQYPGMPGLMALVGGGMATVWAWVQRRNNRALSTSVVAATGIGFLALGTLTWQQTQAYRDETSLWSFSIKMNDRAWAAYNNRGNTYESKRDYDKAIPDYTQAIALRPQYPEAHYNRGKSYGAKGDYDRAIQDYTQAVELEPRYAQAFNSRGAAYSEKGDDVQAVREFTRAIELKPNYEDAYCNRGDVYRRKGNDDAAILDFTKSIELKPDLAVAYNNRGNSYNAKGDYDRAILDFTKAIALQPDYPEALNNRSVAFNAKGDNQQAIRDCTTAIALKPDYALAYYNRGLSYDVKGAFDPAISDFTKAIELQPADAKAYNNRGAAYGKKGDYAQAIRDCSRAIELMPQYAKAYHARGTVYGQSGDPARAIQDFSKAIELKPDDAPSYHNRAATFFLLKEYDKAWADLNKCKQLGGTPNPDLIANLIKASGRTE